MNPITKLALSLALAGLGTFVIPSLAHACGAVTLQIAKSGPESAKAGDVVVYTVTVTQVTSGRATNVVVTDTFPTGFTFLPAQSSPECAAAGGNIVRCGLNTSLSTGQSFTLQLAFQTPAADKAICGPVVNQAKVTAKEKPSGVSAEATTNILCPTPTPTPSPTPTPQPKKGLEIVKSDGGRNLTRPQHSFTYELKATNTGEVDLHDVVISDTIPSPFKILSASEGGTIDGQTVKWENVVLESGKNKRVSITVQTKTSAKSQTNVCNVARAESKDHGLEAEDEECIDIEKQAVKAAVVVKPKAVQVTAKTGAGLSAVVITLLGATGLTMTRKFLG